jgi:MFS family permease
MTATHSLPSSVRSPAQPSWAPLAVLMTGTFMFVLDFFILNVALPSIQHGLRAGESAIEWIVAGYALSTAVLLVTGGRLGDRFGRRRVFTLGMAIFTAASVGCALAPDPGLLVAARIVQGGGAALMAPNILSILGVVYTGPARVRAISVYGMVMGLAATAGQLIGGILIRADVAGLGWRSIFWINVPFGVAALIAAARLVPESRDGQGARLDLTGVVLITACLTAVVLPLVEGRQAGWPSWSWAALGAAVPLAAVFAVHQRRKAARGGAPLLSPRIFAAWPLRAGLLTQTVFWCQQAAGYLVLGLYLQQGRGLSALSAGAVFTVLASGYLATSFRAPALTMRFGRSVIAAGALIAAAGDAALWLATAHAGTSGPVTWLFPGLLLLGAGQGLCITPLTTTVLSHADPVTAGSVAGALSTAQQVGNSVGVAVTGVLFFGALGHGYGVAFERSVLQMAALLLVVAALTRLMGRQRTA